MADQSRISCYDKSHTLGSLIRTGLCPGQWFLDLSDYQVVLH